LDLPAAETAPAPGFPARFATRFHESIHRYPRIKIKYLSLTVLSVIQGIKESSPVEIPGHGISVLAKKFNVSADLFI
jgi:hypothetical protein